MIKWLLPKINISESKNETHNICEILFALQEVLPRWLISAIVLFMYVKIRQFYSLESMQIDTVIAYIGFFMFSFLIIVNLCITKVIIVLEDPFVLKHYYKIIMQNK